MKMMKAYEEKTEEFQRTKKNLRTVVIQDAYGVKLNSDWTGSEKIPASYWPATWEIFKSAIHGMSLFLIGHQSEIG
jgi:hypothetical protein